MDTKEFNEKVLHDASRLAVLRQLALIDAPEEPFFDSLTSLAGRVIGVPVSLVSLVTSSYQFFKSSYGLPEPWQSERRTPLSHSFCKHVVTSGEPLIVDDARKHPLVKDNLAIPDLNVIGYLGVPIKLDDYRFGSFCVIHNEPHQWAYDEIVIMKAFASVVNAEIEARAAAYRNGTLSEHIEKGQDKIKILELDMNQHVQPKLIIRRLNQFCDEIAPIKS